MAQHMLTPTTERQKWFNVYVLNHQQQLHKYADLSKFDAHMREANKKALMVYENPVPVIAGRLAEGDDAAQILTNWTDAALTHIHSLRRQRRKIAVFEAGAGEPELFLAAFQATFPEQEPPELFQQRQEEYSELEFNIAALIVKNDPLATSLLSELQASCALAPPSPLSIKTVLKNLNQELINEKTRRRAEKDATRLMAAQIADLQNSLKSMANQKKEIEKKFANSKSAMQTELSLVYKSTSWRITAPLRAAARLFKR